MRKQLIVVGATAVLILGYAAAPAAAAPTDDTAVTFEIDAGTLDVTSAAGADIGLGPAGTPLTATLGAVSVSDTRGEADSAWDVTVTSTDFTTGGATPTETIAAPLVSYWSGATTATTGTGTFVGQQLNAGAADPLDNATELPALVASGGSGSNTASFAPTAIVTVPLANQAGAYAGTVTHSVL